MNVFVTGGTGFIGRHVVQKLVERGDTVYALAHSEKSAGILSELGAVIVPGDITDSESMRLGMKGCDIVYHLADWSKIGASDWINAEAINVAGTRKVLRLAVELKIPKIIYSSTIAVFGDTRGQLVDESYFNGGPFLTEYARTKWLAHYKVAVPLIEKGAPIIIVMPGITFGPGDTGIGGDLMRRFHRGMPILPAPDTTLTYAYVEDIAQGVILAAELGNIGETYILAGPAVPLRDMVDFWGHLTGRPTPMIRISERVIRPFVPLMEFVSNFVPLPTLLSAEALSLLGATYMAKSEKAKRQLGWRSRPLHATMVQTFEWIAHEEERFAKTTAAKRQRLAGGALGLSLILLIVWLLDRRQVNN